MYVSSLVLILSRQEKANNARFASVKVFGLGIPGNPLRLLPVAPGAFIFLALIIYHFYCRYPPPIRSNERDPGHGAVTAESKKGESRNSRAVRSPPGRLSQVFSHPQGEGGTGISPALPATLFTFRWPGGKRGLPPLRGHGPALPAAAKFSGARVGRGAGSPPIRCRVSSASLAPSGTSPRPWGEKGHENPRRTPGASFPEEEGERLYRHRARVAAGMRSVGR